MGNPSDGFYGKTISLLISNFHVELNLVPNEFDSSNNYEQISFQQSMTSFPSWRSFSNISIPKYQQEDLLLIATCKVFFTHCYKHNILLNDQGFNLSYETNIPRQVGFAGSSAIITALWKALMIFYKVNDYQISLSLQASLVLSVEKDELGIVCGLQDRVIQAFGGLMFMDFDRNHLQTQGVGIYKRIPINNLPRGLWISYDSNPSDSGKR